MARNPSATPDWKLLESQIAKAMVADRRRLRNMLRSIRAEDGTQSVPATLADGGGKEAGPRLLRLDDELRQSVARREWRARAVPRITYDAELPIAARRDEIAAAIRDHQVVIVCGETGSGKSTQLPKICLELGRGVAGLIGHTQPRRIAARSVAARVAEELGTPLGRDVGFKVRFAETLGPQSYIKLMTDGILLAETQSDPLFEQYDTIILDEAHERSLNVDFLIGYLKRLLPQRPDLRVIITSATIDAARFAEHFADGTRSVPATLCPVIEVSGRTYPVEVLWRPIEADEEGNEPDLQDAVRTAVEEAARIDRGDMLIFMPTERDIHETAKTLRSRPLPGDGRGDDTEILPLYARLSVQEQQRVFHPGPKRRIVIATNVAESSLTVPRIRFVIDPGAARISRYSPRSKTQRLPIEAISQASADQRKGRCGRVGPGVCLRLFSEDDYLARDRYTMPEIQRTNLAAVILQMKALRLGELEDFPLIDPPRPDAVKDGYRTLFELGAVDSEQELTEIGRRLARLPVDPRIGRMILAAIDEGCLAEVLVIAAALEVQDPRERPLEKQEAADNAHARFLDEQSDFLSYLKLWDFYHRLRETLSRGQLQKACRQNFLSWTRIREWLDVHRELMEIVREKRGADFQSAKGKADWKSALHYDAIHRAILTGLLSGIAQRGDGHEYTVAGGGKAVLWPGSGLFRGSTNGSWRPSRSRPRAAISAAARIDPRWIEPLAGHLIKRTYSDVYWESKWASAAALERLTLFGLVIVAGRPVRYGLIDPDASRQLFIEHGLVQGDLQPKPGFLAENERLLAEVELLQAKLRKSDLTINSGERSAFYDARLPADVYDGVLLARWLKAAAENGRTLTMTQSDLLHADQDVEVDEFPDALHAGVQLPLDYRFEPGAADDGVTATVPLEALARLDDDAVQWLVPGMLEEKVLALIRLLPKALRTRFVPAPEAACRAAAELRRGNGSLCGQLADVLSRLGGVRVSPSDFDTDRLPAELRMNVRVVDAGGTTLAAGRDLDGLRQELGAEAAAAFTAIDDTCWNRDGLTAWDFDDLPAEVNVAPGRLSMKGYPALVDAGQSVGLRLLDSRQRAEHETRFGLRRLFLFAVGRKVGTQIQWLPGIDDARSVAKLIEVFDLKRELADLLAQRAWPDEAEIPRTKDQFETALAVAKERIGLAVQDLAGLIGPWFAAYREARAALDAAGRTVPPPQKPVAVAWGKLPAPAKPQTVKWQYAIDDIRDQLARLVGPRTLCTTPWSWLRHCPRYFRAIHVRLDALTSGGMAKDHERYEEFLPRWKAYLDRREQHGPQCEADAELVRYRWMLEEYRVSLFAQKLGTSVPVSAKRLEQQWAKVGRDA